MKDLPISVQERWLDSLLAEHPLPWTLDRDWSVEVLDAKGACVITLMSWGDGCALLERAKERAAENAAGEAEFRKLMAELEIDL